MKFSAAHINHLPGYLLILLLLSAVGSGSVEAQPDLRINTHPDIIKGRHFIERNRYDSAHFFYEQASADFLQKQLWREYVFCKAKQGSFANYLGGPFVEIALKDLQAGLDVLTQKGLPEDTIAAELFHYFGQYYHFYEVTKWQKALSFYERGLAARISGFGAVHEKIVESYNWIGRLYMLTLADYKNAERYYQHAMSVLEKLPHKDYFALATAYFHLAAANYNEGDQDKAMTYANQCKEIIDNRLTMYREIFSEKCYALISNILSEKKEFALAIENLERALALNQRSHSLADRMIYYNNLSQNYFLLQDYESSRIYSRKVTQIKETGDPEYFSKYATSLLILARTESLSGEFETARAYLWLAIELVIENYGNNYSLLTDLYHSLGKVHAMENSYDSALQNFQRAVTISTDAARKDLLVNPHVKGIAARPVNFEILADKGALLLSRYLENRDTVLLYAALDAYLKADTLFSYLRDGLSSQQARQLASEKYNTLYDGLVECAWRNWKNRDDHFTRQLLLNMIDKGKSKMEQDLLAEAFAKKMLNIPDSLVDASRDLSVQIAYYRHLQTKPAGLSDKDMRQTEHEIFRLTRLQEKHMMTIQKEYPAFAEVKFGKTPSSYSAVKNFTSANQALILNFFWSQNHLYVCGISGDYFDCHKIPVDSIQLVLRKYVSSLQDYKSETQPEEFNLLGYYLFQKLVAPFLSKKTARIILIPDDLLFQLPFETLPSCKSSVTSFNHGCYLLESYVTSYASTTQTAITDNRHNTKGIDGVLGFSYSRIGVGNPVGTGSIIPEIRGTAEEISVIRQLFDGVFMEGPEATETIFKKRAPDYEILHLALHGESNQNRIGLIFRNERDSLNDGILYPFEIYGLNLKARLAVLSACSSGVGFVHEGEGLVSLASAFNHAGCPAIVMSLWNVTDRQTSTLMQRFYHNIKEGMPADLALQQAKLTFIRESNEPLRHPRYWGAFIVTGDTDQPLAPNTELRNAIAILCALSMMALAWYCRKYFRSAFQRFTPR